MPPPFAWKGKATTHAKVGVRAFSSCTSLASITLPESIAFIGDDAFKDCPNLTLTVPHDSYAEAYAEASGLAYIYPDSYDWLNGNP